MLLGLAMATVSHARADDALPFTVSFEKGWTATVLRGVSSAPQDRDLGVRQRAQRQGPDGSALMEFACMWLTHRPDEAAELDKATASLSAAFEAQGATLQRQPSRVARHGRREWHQVDGSIDVDGETAARLRMGVSLGERCLMTFIFTGTPDSFEQQEEDFERALASLREVSVD